jgi:hypothetical protein
MFEVCWLSGNVEKVYLKQRWPLATLKDTIDRNNAL